MDCSPLHTLGLLAWACKPQAYKRSVSTPLGIVDEVITLTNVITLGREVIFTYFLFSTTMRLLILSLVYLYSTPIRFCRGYAMSINCLNRPPIIGPYYFSEMYNQAISSFYTAWGVYDLWTRS